MMVADLSRYSPLPRVFEEYIEFDVTGESVTFPADTDADRIVDGADISSTADGDTLTIAAQPDVPRNLTMTVTDASGNITNMSVIVRGTDKDGMALEETLHYAKGQGVITGKEYFKTVNQVEVDQIDGNTSGETLDIGIGAYTDVWVYLAEHPVAHETESATDDASAAITRGTDYSIDYLNGRVKAISGGDISAEEVCTFAYDKIYIGVNISEVADLIRVDRVEYPVGRVPQEFVPSDNWGVAEHIVFVTGEGEYESQSYLREGQTIRVYYDAEHIPPNDFAPGTVPSFLEDVVIRGAGAYALLMYALKREHQVVTDIASMRTSLTAANTAHTALGTALTNVKKYLDNNTSADAAGILASITTDAAALRTAISTALDAANTYLDLVATTDFVNADNLVNSYMGTTNYANKASLPSILQYLADGDDLINTITEGGENEKTPETYAVYAQMTKSIIDSFSELRNSYFDTGRIRTNAALGYTQEAAQRLSNLRSYIEQSTGYANIANTFAREAEARIAEIQSYLQQASAYGEAASGELVLADRFRADALDRRNEVLSILGDRTQYIGDFTMGSVRQVPTGD
jgi:hypothetical protein